MAEHQESTHQAVTSTRTSMAAQQTEVAQAGVVKKPKKVKELFVRRTRIGAYEIRYAGGGETPGVLAGEYTKMSIAQAAIAKYNEDKPKVGKKNGKGKD